jgi:hypothetical protein
VHIFCLTLFEEKLNKFINQINIDRISGLTEYPAGYPAWQSAIRPDTGYQKGWIIRPDILELGM